MCCSETSCPLGLLSSRLRTTPPRSASTSLPALRLCPDASISPIASNVWDSGPSLPPIHPSCPTPALRSFPTRYLVPGQSAWSDAASAAADDLFTFYANGALVGSVRNTADLWKSAHIFHSANLCAASTFVFAVRATKRPDMGTGSAGSAGLLFSALVTFSDGSSSLLSSSTSTSTATGAWKATTSIPASWPSSLSLGTCSVTPQNTSVVVAPPTASTPSLTTAIWMWDAAGAASDALGAGRLLGHVRPRRGASEVITADDLFVLWVGGVQRDVVFAVLACIVIRLAIDGSWKVIEGPTRVDDVFGGETTTRATRFPGRTSRRSTTASGTTIRRHPAKGHARARAPAADARLWESHARVDYGADAGVRVPDPLLAFQYQSKRLVEAVGRIIAGWVPLTVSGPKNNFQSDRYWLAGTGAPEVFEPKFSYDLQAALGCDRSRQTNKI
ncbi:hypothetical protein B0H16DRAFT_1791511 [Mycena metata]|uniref:Uncharacterized protein n=1 Tax=Mycena metata TaxID=1033252 RepID=A0AAD7MK79_9AGAR|nr:hypothetical protein B0H16DRAFT_1791511 [Mycena metata]